MSRLREHKLIDELSLVSASIDNRVITTRSSLLLSTKKTDTQIDVNKIIIISQRLKSLVIPRDYDKRIDLKINPTLPKDELIALVEKIKDDYDKDNGIVRTPLELLDTDLQKADDISKMCTESKNGKQICFDGRKGLSRTQKLADMFFIYDMVKQGRKELSIRYSLSEYYEQIRKSTDMSDTTFRKYRDIAIDYIDNQRYKELVCGIKS